MVIVDGAVSFLAPGYEQPPTRWCALMQKILFVMLYSYAYYHYSIQTFGIYWLASTFCPSHVLLNVSKHLPGTVLLNDFQSFLDWIKGTGV